MGEKQFRRLPENRVVDRSVRPRCDGAVPVEGVWIQQWRGDPADSLRVETVAGRTADGRFRLAPELGQQR